MKVIGAGLGGTGTLQAKAALEALGFGPCYHIAEVERHPEQVGLWRGVADGAARDWDALFGAYESCVDFPACVLYAELLDEYPDARIVLTVRDPERAYERVRESIYRLTTRDDSPFPAPLREVFDRLVWDRVFGGAFEDREAAVAAYRRWEEEVRASVPAEQLLVYDVSEGWEPLCSFLGREVPAEPFPD
jgi:Sulfotransferase domain